MLLWALTQVGRLLTNSLQPLGIRAGIAAIRSTVAFWLHIAPTSSCRLYVTPQLDCLQRRTQQ